MWRVKYLLLILLVIFIIAFFIILIKINGWHKDSSIMSIIHMFLIIINRIFIIVLPFLLIPYSININLKNVYIKLFTQIALAVFYMVIIFKLGGYYKLSLSDNIFFLFYIFLFSLISNINLSKDEDSVVRVIENAFIYIPRLAFGFNLYIIYTYFIEDIVKIYA